MTPAPDAPGESVAVILARMEVKLDTVLNSVVDHETRIRVLEKKVWTAAGSSAALTAPITFLVSYLTQK
jgi:hypothetical protein